MALMQRLLHQSQKNNIVKAINDQHRQAFGDQIKRLQLALDRLELERSKVRQQRLAVAAARQRFATEIGLASRRLQGEEKHGQDVLLGESALDDKKEGDLVTRAREIEMEEARLSQDRRASLSGITEEAKQDSAALTQAAQANLDTIAAEQQQAVKAEGVIQQTAASDAAQIASDTKQELNAIQVASTEAKSEAKADAATLTADATKTLNAIAGDRKAMVSDANGVAGSITQEAQKDLAAVSQQRDTVAVEQQQVFQKQEAVVQQQATASAAAADTYKTIKVKVPVSLQGTVTGEIVKDQDSTKDVKDSDSDFDVDSN